MILDTATKPALKQLQKADEDKVKNNTSSKSRNKPKMLKASKTMRFKRSSLVSKNLSVARKEHLTANKDLLPVTEKPLAARHNLSVVREKTSMKKQKNLNMSKNLTVVKEKPHTAKQKPPHARRKTTFVSPKALNENQKVTSDKQKPSFARQKTGKVRDKSSNNRQRPSIDRYGRSSVRQKQSPDRKKSKVVQKQPSFDGDTNYIRKSIHLDDYGKLLLFVDARHKTITEKPDEAKMSENLKAPNTPDKDSTKKIKLDISVLDQNFEEVRT